MSLDHPRIGIRETFGLSPLPVRAREAWLALRGGEHLPPSRFGPSSLRIFQPLLSVKTWLGWRPADRRIPIYNLFNRTPTPLDAGWSVRKTQVSDFRGGTLTYDSHNGTDFAIPVGTPVTAAAAGKVLRVSSEFNRGGLKVFIDHGQGLVTTSNHLARSLVAEGEMVARGQVVALSGYSGLDGLVAFPWSVPHVHFNVWLNGEYVDPFAVAVQGEVSLWLRHNDPQPHLGEDPESVKPTAWSEQRIAAAIDDCMAEDVRRQLLAIEPLDIRAMAVMFQRNYYPTRFRDTPPLYEQRYERSPRLSLPFRAQEYDGIALPPLG